VKIPIPARWLALVATLVVCCAQCGLRTAIDPGAARASHSSSDRAAPTASAARGDTGQGCGARPENALAPTNEGGGARLCKLLSDHARLPTVTVRPGDNLPPLLLWVFDAQVVLLPSDDPHGVWLVEGLGPLEFNGAFRVPDESLEFLVGTKASTPLAQGVVHLSAGARVSLQQVLGEQVAASFRVAEFQFEGILIPCSALTVVKLRWDDHPQGVSAGWHAQDKEIVLSPRPGAPPSVTIRPPNLMAGSKPDAQGWVQIVGSDINGRIVGWTPASRLVWTEPERPLGGGLGLSGMGEGGCGCGCGAGLGAIGCLGKGCEKRYDDPERAYTGEATIHAGTVVYAEPGRGAWAKISREHGVAVAFERGEPWGRLLRDDAAGVSDESECCGEFHHAWVHRSAVRFPRKG
jgi:hypothetical protein